MNFLVEILTQITQYGNMTVIMILVDNFVLIVGVGSTLFTSHYD